MKFSIIILLLLSFSTAYSADLRVSSLSATDMAGEESYSANHKLTNSNSIFNQIGNMFSKGALPEKEELYGWWSGRCYRNKSQDTPTAALMYTQKIKDADHGPVFSGKENFRMSLLLASTPSNKFDQISKDEIEEFKEIIKQTKAKLKQSKAKIITKEKDGSLVSTLGRPYYTLSLRKYRHYFVGELNWRGDIRQNCYFFKKVYSY
ncbi:MAG: hypothetical protein HAW60_05410 [Bdellovibrionales bacterium]|nr:hypothetical protein [Bdellovibrionales bacterium]